jgi:excisionase family DNA binding protein
VFWLSGQVLDRNTAIAADGARRRGRSGELIDPGSRRIMMTRASRADHGSRSAQPAANSPAPPDKSGPHPSPAAERLAYSVGEAARLTGLSLDLLYDEMRRGNLAYLKVGRRCLITRHHFEQCLEITLGTVRPRGTGDSQQKSGSGAP